MLDDAKEKQKDLVGQVALCGNHVFSLCRNIQSQNGSFPHFLPIAPGSNPGGEPLAGLANVPIRPNLGNTLILRSVESTLLVGSSAGGEPLWSSIQRMDPSYLDEILVDRISSVRRGSAGWRGLCGARGANADDPGTSRRGPFGGKGAEPSHRAGETR